MPEFTSEIEIEPYEYVDGCSRSELQELIDVLVEDGWVDEEKEEKDLR